LRFGFICWAVGASGTILFSTGGGSWSSQTSGTSNTLNGVSCPDASHCWAAGDSGTILFSTGGGTWSSQTSGTSNGLTGVSFPSTCRGWAVGISGTILAFTDVCPTPSASAATAASPAVATTASPAAGLPNTSAGPDRSQVGLWLLLPAGLALVGGGLALVRGRGKPRDKL
jgi:photosystem II stability/assembly factor-like uncharacterized protein